MLPESGPVLRRKTAHPAQQQQQTADSRQRTADSGQRTADSSSSTPMVRIAVNRHAANATVTHKHTFLFQALSEAAAHLQGVQQ